MTSVFWHRRDLRLNDNAGLFYALKENKNVLPIFIFDTAILSNLNDKNDKRVLFIYQTIKNLKNELQKLGSDLYVFYGNIEDIFKQLFIDFNVKNIYTNHDYEPYALKRDAVISELAKVNNIVFKSYKDQCIFEFNEVLKDDGLPYTVFTPYSKKWKLKLNEFYLKPYANEKYFNNYCIIKPKDLIHLEDMGFNSTQFKFSEPVTKRSIIKNYEQFRDIPSVNGTSRLSLHFRFGTISIRQKASNAIKLSEKWLNELIWRDFYMQIIAHFPHVVYEAFKPQYNNIEWRNNEDEFKAWCDGKTGYPIVDAGMRELNNTGFMHNRVRMIVASFLTKHLLIDWRWGEAYFAEKLLDFELSSNNGGWQWAAGSGVDAAPYFRVFNPYLQTEKFDPYNLYIKQWIPEFNTPHYPKPIVEHTFARNRCLKVYKEGLKPK